MVKFAIGIDLGGTNTKIGLVDGKGRIIQRSRLATAEFPSRAALIDAMVSEIRSVCGKAHVQVSRLSGVGIGVPGLVDFSKGLVYNLTNVPGWKNTPLKKLLGSKLKVPVLVDNDVNVMALGECRFGAGKGSKDLVCITLGTGVGGGIIIDGKIYRGATFSAGEVGHMPLKEEGLPCGCGSRGCLERYVGNRYISEEFASMTGRDPSGVTPETISKAAQAGDKAAIDFWETVGARIGVTLAGIVNLLNPERIIIGGGVADAGEVLFAPIRRTVDERAMAVPKKAVNILKAKLANDAGMIGAAALFL